MSSLAEAIERNREKHFSRAVLTGAIEHLQEHGIRREGQALVEFMDGSDWDALCILVQARCEVTNGNR